MAYTPEQARGLATQHHASIIALQTLMLRFVSEGRAVADPLVQEQMLHGAGRRIGVIARSAGNIFNLFPPSAERPLSVELLTDVQINLHAFVINLCGLLDNMAWAFVLRHGVEDVLADRRNVGLFNRATTRCLPLALREHLSSDLVADWHTRYLKNYRDALAHRIPLYIPPAIFTREQADLYQTLEDEKMASLRVQDWQRLGELWAQQAALGVPCFDFYHAFSGDDPVQPVQIHTQVVSDSRAAVELGTLYLEHWAEAPQQ